MERMKWRKSIEVAGASGGALVSDSKDPDGPRLAFGPQEWRAFAARVKADANSPR
jgi:Domain of unknown function (DUF397)